MSYLKMSDLLLIAKVNYASSKHNLCLYVILEINPINN